MGWVWKGDDADDSRRRYSGRGLGEIGELGQPEDRCLIRRVVQSRCKVEAVEPGKYVNKCEKTEKLLRDCAGRPAEMVESNTEYTEEDVTDQVMRGSIPFDSSPSGDAIPFPGLRSDLEALERDMFGGFNRFMENFMEAADEMRNGFFRAFGMPSIFERNPREVDGYGPSRRLFEEELSSEQKDESAYAELAGKVRDV